MRLAWIIPLCLATGCAGQNWHRLWEAPLPAASATNPVVQVVALWQVADGQDANGRACRGFGGQVFFITRNQQLPSVVEGTVRISLFDDQGPSDEQAKPVHQYDFTPEAWETHMERSKLGPAYIVFIPYPRPGVRETQCSLHVRLEQKNGIVATSQMVNVVLPGVSDKPEEEDNPTTAAAPPPPTGIQQATHLATREDAVVPAVAQLSPEENSVRNRVQPVVAQQIPLPLRQGTPEGEEMAEPAMPIEPVVADAGQEPVAGAHPLRDLVPLSESTHPLARAERAAAAPTVVARRDPIKMTSPPASPTPPRAQPSMQTYTIPLSGR